MANLFDSMFRLSFGMAEAGLQLADSALRSAQSTLENLIGQRPDPSLSPPLNGPRNLDHAVADLADRTAAILRFTPRDTRALPRAWREWLKAARHCFAFVDLKDPRSLALPWEIPLSMGTLATQSGLRAAALGQVAGPRRFPSFVARVTEMFTEIQAYVSLQSKEIIERYEERLRQEPGDAAWRLELGRVLIKCGRYDEAVAHLRQAAEDSAVRATAWHECSVALYRAGRFLEAAAAGVQALNEDPANERARAGLWLTAQKLGGYLPETPPSHCMEVKTGYHPAGVEFEDVAAQVGLDKTSAGRGVAVFDYNNDGHLDVLIAAAQAGCTLYRNNGDGSFTDVTIGSGLEDAVNGFIVSVGDYNNDGWADFFLTRLGFFAGESQLFRNNGDGTFTDVTVEAGLRFWGPGFTACWADYDNDGFLDLFVAQNLGSLFERKIKNRLFHNNGDGTFTEVADQAGLYTSWPTMGACWGDYNNDGFADLFISNAMGRSQLYRNNGNGTFTDVSRTAGLDTVLIGTNAYWCDYDNDGWLDLIQHTWSDHEDVIHTLRRDAGPEDGSPLRIYHNNRDGTFTLRSPELGVTGCWGTMSGNAADFNNDGHVDLILGNGGPRMERLEPLVLLEYDGRRFRNTTFSAGLPFIGKSHGANCADLFGDGRMCILVAAGGAYYGDLLTSSCYRARRLAGNYLNVRLTGVKSNRDAIGARLKLLAGGGEQHRLVGGGSNFGCLPFEQHFGLADLDQVDALEVWWPSGIKQRVERPPVNRAIRITEGRNDWEDVHRKRL